MASKSTLAIAGGVPLVPRGTIHRWPPISELDHSYIRASLDGTDHSYGPNCRRFAEEFAAWNGNRLALHTNSGTAALHMCVAAVGCAVGDEVIVPAYSWSSSATAILHHSCIPVFVDIDWDTMNIDAAQLAAAITDKTKAILVVHLHGLSASMSEIKMIAKAHNLAIIEDACQSHGARHAGQHVGTLGDCAAFSFNQNKTLSSGEGGMFATDREDLFSTAQQLWSFGETCPPGAARDYHAVALGWMYRGSDLPAAFGRAQLTRLDRYIEVQRANAARLSRCLTGVPGLILPVEPQACLHTYSTYTIRLDMNALGRVEGARQYRDRFVAALSAEGLDSGVSQWQRFILPEMNVFRQQNAFGRGHPWSSPHARKVTYDAEHFPKARSHCDWSFGISTPLREPHTEDTAELIAECIVKVLHHLD